MSPAAAPLYSVALLGSPNSGKTTLFNALTGMRAKTGNYPGVTVDRREGLARTPAGAVQVVDLPGTYSLHALSQEEAVAVQVLKGEIGGERAPDGVVLVADATTLPRSLPFLAEVLQLGRPTCLVLTMVDELKARGGEIDLARLQQELGVAVVPVVGNKGLGIDDLKARLADLRGWSKARGLPEGGVDARFAWADRLLERVTRRRPAPSALTRRLDAVLLHPLAGGLIFLLFISAFFQAIFSWAAPLMDALDGAVNAGADALLARLPDGLLTGLLVDGVVRGVGAVIVFVPQITLLFALIFLFEACGYMARAAFVADRIMGWVGLEGRCFIALLSSYACAVPGILATRTIPSPRDRLATILVAPFATCSARLPVYALLIGAFIPAAPVLGPFTLQGLTLMGLYLLGTVSALLFAAVFKRGLLRGATLPFYLELPPYRFPSLASVAVQVWRRVKLFLRRAGTVILGASLLLWLLLHFPRAETPAGTPAPAARQAQIESSYGAALGRAMEPLLAPMGWDWRIGVGLIGSFAAREVMVSTMAQTYAYAGADQEYQGLAELLSSPDPRTGKAPLSLPAALALMVFFVYALQCISTIAVIRREAGKWKYALFALGYMTGTAWLASFVTYRIAAAFC